jgi:hypothetical protein
MTFKQLTDGDCFKVSVKITKGTLAKVKHNKSNAINLCNGRYFIFENDLKVKKVQITVE